VTVGDTLLNQARRQRDAAGGAPVVWHIAEEKALRAMEHLGLGRYVILKHTP
jgi:hypothetical protein